jgi:hypothetical protein
MTADAEVEMSEYVPNDWALTSGSIICQMRDGDPRNAHLIAAAPELQTALDGIIQWWAEMGGDFDVDDMPVELWDKAQGALKKARGGVK